MTITCRSPSELKCNATSFSVYLCWMSALWPFILLCRACSAHCIPYFLHSRFVVLHVASQLILIILLVLLQMNVSLGKNIGQVLHLGLLQCVLPGLVEGGLVISALTRGSRNLLGHRNAKMSESGVANLILFENCGK